MLQNKGLLIIVVAVVLMLIGMIVLVKDLQDSGKLKKAHHEVMLDSLTTVRFNELLQNDSLLSVQIERQSSEIENLKLKVTGLRNKVNTLTQ